MPRSLLALGVAVAVVVAAAGCSTARPETAATAAPVSSCDRACLEGFVDRYLTALAAHDPSSLPLAPDVKFVENNEVLRVGEGTWKTVTGLGTYRHYFADLAAGQVAVISVVEERGTKIIYDLRLKVHEGRIAEIEAMAVRDPNGAKLYEELGKPLPIFLQPVPVAERAPREELIKVANKYLSGMENNDPKGDYSFFADDCNRLEHARQTTNMKSEKYGHSNDSEFVTQTCRQQFETGFLGFVTRIRDRRFVVVDEERQTVFAFVFLDHNGTVRKINMSQGKVFTVPSYFSVPRTLQVGEAWRVERGKLRQIEMTLSEFPYGKRPAFDSGDKWLDTGATSVAAQPARADETCDRACLKGMVDTFLRALVTHDRSALALSPTVRYTENGQQLNVGDGLWGTVTAVGGGGQYFAGPTTEDAGYYGAITEHDTPGVLAVRLRVEGRMVTEIEAIAVRQETAGERGGTLTLFAPRLPKAFDPLRQGELRGGLRRTLVRDMELGRILDVAIVDVLNLPSASTGPFTVMVPAVTELFEGARKPPTDSAFRPVPYGWTPGWPSGRTDEK